MLNKHIDIPREQIVAFCEKYPIRKLSLFGSVLRDDFNDESDVDVLVEYSKGTPVTLLDMAQQEIELSEIFGRKVDLRTSQELSRYFRQQVINQAMLVYECK